MQLVDYMEPGIMRFAHDLNQPDVWYGIDVVVSTEGQ